MSELAEAAAAADAFLAASSSAGSSTTSLNFKRLPPLKGLPPLSFEVDSSADSISVRAPSSSQSPVDTLPSPAPPKEDPSDSLLPRMTAQNRYSVLRETYTSDPTPSTVLSALEAATADAENPEEASTRAAVVLRKALNWAVKHADVELVGWLAGLVGPFAELLDAEVATMQDDDGWGIVGMAIQSSCGLSDKEEAVRLIVGRWGVSAGPRYGRDTGGRTPLHLAALLSSPQIVSVLLNRGASPAALTDSGLSAYDMVMDMEGRESISLLLDPLHADEPSETQQGDSSRYTQQPMSPRRKELIQRRRIRIATRSQREERRVSRARVAADRERWVRERARNIGVNAGILFPAPENKPAKDEEEADNEEEEDAEMAELASASNYLIFGLNQLPFIFDTYITRYPPLCRPQEKRSLPANALYLYARFAHSYCDDSWLEELIDGAIERIERGVYSNGEDLAYLAFWEYNLTLLLFLIRSDEPLHAACTELNLLGMMEELINAIHVFVIRIAERKIDEILDPAMLDFESLEDFDDVRFADQWSIFGTFRSKKKTPATPLATAMFMPSTPEKNGLDSPLSPIGPPSPTTSTGRSIQELKADAKDAIASGIEKAQAVFGDKPSPRRVADVLTNVLLILQLYDVNPAFIVQVFSQTFYWISSELFNRIITRRKYLCRTKAVQIRMNITALEDWTRQNGLPPNVATKHLQPIMQLLQWLQCLSQIREFDTLIATVQGLRALNPLQMRRAVRDYRYEVDEGRMADDCIQYLTQMQKDWERQRVHIGVKNAQSQLGVVGYEDDSMPIEALFDGGVGIGDWVPQTAPECLGELVDSRFMLPFLVPSTTEYLMAMPPPDAAFRNLMIEAPRLPDGSIPSRPLSAVSYSSSRPMGWVSASEARVRQLPDDFFEWLKASQDTYAHEWDLHKPPVPPKIEEEKSGINDVTPTRAPPPPSLPLTDPSKILQPPPLSPLPEEQLTPSNKALPRIPNDSPQSTPSQAHARKASADLAQQEDVTPPGTEKIELVSRPTPPSNGKVATDLSRVQSNGSAGSPHYELARVRRGRNVSVSSQTSTIAPSSGSSEKKKWWKLGRKSSVGSIGSLDDATRDRRREREESVETVMPSPTPRRGNTIESITSARMTSPSANSQPLVDSPPSTQALRKKRSGTWL